MPLLDGALDPEDMIDEIEFTSIHRILCGLSSVDLASEIKTHPELLDQGDMRRCPPLWWAIHLRDLHAVKILLEHGASTDFIDKEGSNVLHICANTTLPIAQLVLGSMPIEDVLKAFDARDKYGSLPQHLVFRGEILRLFLEHGARITALDSRGRSLVQLAMNDDRGTSYAETLMIPGVASIDLAPNVEEGWTLYDVYDWFYPTNKHKQSPEGKAKLALLRYVECLQLECESICDPIEPKHMVSGFIEEVFADDDLLENEDFEDESSRKEEEEEATHTGAHQSQSDEDEFEDAVDNISH